MMGFYHQKYGLVNRALKDNNEFFSVGALTILMMMKQKGKSIADYNTDCRYFRDFNNSTAHVSVADYGITRGKYYSVQGSHSVTEGETTEVTTTCTDALYFD